MKLVNSFKIAGLSILLFFSCAAPVNEQTTQDRFYKPWESLDPLFREVQMAEIFPDSKTFVDCTPKASPEEILIAYQAQKDKSDFDLEGFVNQYFTAPAELEQPTVLISRPFEEHLTEQWNNLVRAREESGGFSTLIELPEQYIVPGGRFREIYYWDSYFTMIGLGVSGRTDLVASMLDNFAYLIDTVGFIPNGNRTYYLGRSQPPFFSSMVNLYGQLAGSEAALKYLPAIEREYAFWMQGSEELSADRTALNRVVLLDNGAILNRYWDFLDFARPESHREDVELAAELPNNEKSRLYRNLRAGAESGWDYSTRWFEDKSEFSSIRTIDMLPIDLNCLLFATESLLAEMYVEKGMEKAAKSYQNKAEARMQAIQSVFWHEDQGAFTDYIWTEKRQSNQVTLASTYPLYFKIATEKQASTVANNIEEDFLLPGGVVTTKIASGQQWDYPNGWAPLQWVTIKGLDQYGNDRLAKEIAARWLNINKKVYLNTGKMMEKYNVADTSLLAGGGEYPTQDGFGWTNGIALALMADSVAY